MEIIFELYEKGKSIEIYLKYHCIAAGFIHFRTFFKSITMAFRAYYN